MDESDLKDDAAKLREQMKLVPPREPGEPLRPADEAKILELSREGMTQQDIARVIGCHQSTVSRTLAEYDDSRPLARQYLEAKALEMTKRLVTDAKPETILKVLGKLDVVREDVESGNTAVAQTLVVIGAGSVPLGAFQANDYIAAIPGIFPDEPPLLRVYRGDERCVSAYPLPCPVSEIPPHVKITPEALDVIKSGNYET